MDQKQRKDTGFLLGSVLNSALTEQLALPIFSVDRNQ